MHDTKYPSKKMKHCRENLNLRRKILINYSEGGLTGRRTSARLMVKAI